MNQILLIHNINRLTNLIVKIKTKTKVFCKNIYFENFDI